MSPLGIALALLIGLSLGLLGGGGSILTVPVFVYVLGHGAKAAIAMSLPVVGTTSLFGAIGHWRAGNVQPRIALAFGLVAMVGAFAGARLGVLVREDVQLLLLAVVTVVAALAMLRRRPEPPAGSDAPRRSLPLIAAAGLGVGVLTGLVGIGGGFMIVPALVILVGLPMPQAVGTSLAVITMNAAAGALGYAGAVDFDWPLVLAFTALAIAGVLVGTRLVRHVAPRHLRRAFALLLLGVGASMLWQNRAVFGTTAAPLPPATAAHP